jgi:hypothetical protein
MEKKKTKLNPAIRIIPQNNSFSNKSRTNLLVLANEDLKNTMKKCQTRINSRNLNEFVKDFDSVVVNLAKETFTSYSNVNLGQDELSKHFVKGNFPARSWSKKDFDYRKKRFSISEKKIEFFNRKLKESMEGNLKSNYNTNQTDEDALRAINIEQRKSESRKSESKRKYSLIRLRDKLKEEMENKIEKRYEKAVEGFDYLQSVCLALKKENYIIEEEKDNRSRFFNHEIKFNNRPSAKSCEKRNMKMLSELMKNLQENLNDERGENKNIKVKNSEKSSLNKFKSLTRTNENKNNEQYQVENKKNFSNYKIADADSLNRNQKIESSDAESSKTPKDNFSYDNYNLHNSANTIRSISYGSSLESKRILRINSVEENLYEKDFKINVYRCSFSSLADQERDLDYFYGSSGYTPKSFKDFNIQLKNCRRSKDEYDSLSRKMSEITPPSSVNEEAYEY